jgi:hypothetical protein
MQYFSIHRIKILIWFLKRPVLYKQFLREIYSFFKRDIHPTLNRSKEALKWCEQYAVDEPTAISRINPNWEFIDFNKEFPDLVKQAFEVINSFEFNWGGQGNLSLNYNIANHLKAKRILETGVAYGWSALSLLKSIYDQDEGKLISIDMPFWGTKYENKVGCVIPENFKDRWTLIRRPDRDSIPKVLKNNVQFDMCHYDSDKSYKGKCWALPRLWKCLRDGGILLCDDINDNLAFKDFCYKHNIKPIIAKTFDSQVVKYVGIAVKTSEA